MTRAHRHPLIDPCGRLRTTRDAHFRIALRLLDADAEGADWREVARIVLLLDPEHESDHRPEGVRQPFIARQMDDGAWLPAPVAWWRSRLKTMLAIRHGSSF
jgi:hypothetical protein